MSHFVTIETQIRDLTALEAACAELGVELLRDAQARGFANSTRNGELVVRLKGPYDIAANRATGQEGEAYTLTTDWWNGHVEKEVGPNYGRLLQLYGVHKTMQEASRKRLRVTASSSVPSWNSPRPTSVPPLPQPRPLRRLHRRHRQRRQPTAARTAT